MARDKELPDTFSDLLNLESLMAFGSMVDVHDRDISVSPHVSRSNSFAFTDKERKIGLFQAILKAESLRGDKLNWIFVTPCFQLSWGFFRNEIPQASLCSSPGLQGLKIWVKAGLTRLLR